jgi:hypothetical protein
VLLASVEIFSQPLLTPEAAEQLRKALERMAAETEAEAARSAMPGATDATEVANEELP